jgi:hypothetical protein
MGKSRNAMFKGIRLPDETPCPDDLTITANATSTRRDHLRMTTGSSGKVFGGLRIGGRR